MLNKMAAMMQVSANYYSDYKVMDTEKTGGRGAGVRGAEKKL
jgi:hypothetical protein